MPKQELSPIIWSDETQSVKAIDQRLLPYEYKYVKISNLEEMAEAIRSMLLRGAPLIGIAAAYGMAMAARDGLDLDTADKLLRSTRPTAVNLMWALDEIQSVIRSCKKAIKPNQDQVSQQKLAYEQILDKAKWIHADDIDRCKRMGDIGAKYICDKFNLQNTFANTNKLPRTKKLRIMTHCNAGALATGGYGTALGVIRSLHRDGLVEMVYANETRPRQQGARLTAWELAHDSIPVTLVTDNMAAHLMQAGDIDLVITGADRIAANGDAANKIGTYGLAIIAEYHNIPFYIAAPMSTFDFNLKNGRSIPIEERGSEEVSHINGQTCTAQIGIEFRNPAFDVTPAALVEAYFTEDAAKSSKELALQLSF